MDYSLEKELKIKESVSKIAKQYVPTNNFILSCEPYQIEGLGWSTAELNDEKIFYFGDVTIGHMDSGENFLLQIKGEDVFEVTVQNKTVIGTYTDLCFNGAINTGNALPIFCGYKITFL